VDGYVFAQPLYVANVTVNRYSPHVVYVPPSIQRVCFDADSIRANAQPLWHTVSFDWVTSVSSTNAQLRRHLSGVWITGTPVIDLSTNIVCDC